MALLSRILDATNIRQAGRIRAVLAMAAVRFCPRTAGIMNKCWLKEDINQCCCNCQHHVPDYYHCTIDTQLRDHTGGCVCSIQKGWICAGFAHMEGESRYISNWPEHSVGCELYTPKDSALTGQNHD